MHDKYRMLLLGDKKRWSWEWYSPILYLNYEYNLDNKKHCNFNICICYMTFFFSKI